MARGLPVCISYLLHVDLLLFDSDSVARGKKRHVYYLPGGGTRVGTPAVAVHDVWISGTRVADEAAVNGGGEKPGQLLRDFDS